MTIGDGGPAGRAERVRGAYGGRNLEDESDQEWNRPGAGAPNRILVVVILLHVAGIAGVLGYKWIHRDGGEAGQPDSPASQAARPPVEQLIPQPRTNGKAIVVDHPTLKGHVRYRVASNEQLIEVARQFNASVAEIEQLNSLRLDSPLYPGQWLTVPDHRERLDDGTVLEPKGGAKLDPKSGDVPGGGVPAKEPVRAKVIAPKPQPKPGGDSGAGAGQSKEPVRAKVIAAEPEPPKKVEPKVEPKPEPLKTPRQPQSPAPLPVAAEQTYKVNGGDTAYRIALRFGVTWQELLEFNGLTDPKQLRAGQVLKIPPKR